MKITYISARGDSFGGASLHVCDMARRLSDDGHEVKILVGGSPDMEVPQRFAEKNLDFTCIPDMGRSLNPKKDYKAMLTIRREIKAFGPDLVSAHASKGGALGRVACRKLDIPVLYTPHCWSFVDGFPKAGLYLNIEKSLARLATRIITVCEQERQFGLSKGVGKENETICIHNGVTNGVVPAPLRNEGIPNILMVARFEDQKDHKLLIRALARVQNFEWRVTFVGEGPLKESCENLARELGIYDRIRFLGYSNKVHEHLAEADIFALITNWEGFPRSILEAMRSGLPAIVSDVGGCKESVIDGQTGRVVARGDQNGLVDALREVLASSTIRKAMGIRAHKLYEEKFTFDHMYQRYCQLYQSLS